MASAEPPKINAFAIFIYPDFLFKTFIIHLSSARRKEDILDLLQLQPSVVSDIDCHDVLIIRRSHVEDSWLSPRLQIRDNHKDGHHPKGCQQNSQLECNRNKIRERGMIFTTDDHRPVKFHHVKLHGQSQCSPQQSEKKCCNRKFTSFVAQYMLQSVNRIRRIYLVNLHASASYFLYCMEQNVLIVVYSQDKMCILFHDYLCTFSDEDLSTDFTSAMLITGKNFANRKNKVKNSPNVNA